MTVHIINDPSKIRDLAKNVLDANGHPKVMPASFYADTSQEERSLFAVRNGLYGLHTQELVDWLRAFIGQRSAIEIGAGNGVLAKALGITATDNFMQDNPAIRLLYEQSKQPPVKYGQDVERIDAAAAVRKYRPQVVIGSWITRRYTAAEPERGGNMFGVDELDILAHCQHYVLIGNARVHANSALVNHGDPEQLLTPDWLYSRAMNGTPNFIGVWRGAGWTPHP